MAEGAAETLDSRVEALLERGDRAAALAVCDEATEARALELTRAGVALSEAGEHDGALRTLRRAERRAPNSRIVLTQLGLALEDSGRLEEAVEVYERGLEASRKSEAQGKEVWSLTLLGHAYCRVGRVRDAIRTLRRAVEVDPTYEEAHLFLGEALDRKGDCPGAEEHWHTAIELDPKYPEAHYNLAVVLAERDEVGEALKHLERAIALEFGEAHSVYGYLLYRRGAQFKKRAVRHLKRAVELNGADVWAHLYIGNWHWTCGRLDEALECFSTGSQTEPDEPMALVCMADIHQVRRQWDKALSLCERALELSPKFVPAMQNVAECWIRKGDLQTARRYLDRVAATPGERSSYYTKVRVLLEEREEATRAAADEWAEFADEDLKPVKRRW